MALPVNGSTHLIPAYYSFIDPKRPSWLTCSGWSTHISGHPSAAGRAQDRESSPVRDRRSTTVLNRCVCISNYFSTFYLSARAFQTRCTTATRRRGWRSLALRCCATEPSSSRARTASPFSSGLSLFALMILCPAIRAGAFWDSAIRPSLCPRSQTVGFHSRLPDDVTSATALLTFRRKLKARLFRQSYLAYFHLEHTRTHTPV